MDTRAMAENFEFYGTYRQYKQTAANAVERELVDVLLTRFNGNITLASQAMKMDRKHLSDLCKKHTINPVGYRNGSKSA